MVHRDFALFIAISVHSMNSFTVTKTKIQYVVYNLLANIFSSVSVTKPHPRMDAESKELQAAVCTCTRVGIRVGHNLCTPAEFYVNLIMSSDAMEHL